jgi:hypothetical protein
MSGKKNVFLAKDYEIGIQSGENNVMIANSMLIIPRLA